MSPYFSICLLLLFYTTVLCDQLIVLNSPPGVTLSAQKDVSLADVKALPYQLFGLDETQSRILSDVSFFRRPTLLGIVTVACAGQNDPACTDAFVTATAEKTLRHAADADSLVFHSSAGLAESLASAHLDKSLLASTDSLLDSTHPTLFTGLDAPAALPDEAGLPERLVRRMRLAQAAVDRVIASGYLADPQPDVLQIDLADGDVTGLPTSARRRVAEFAVRLANRLVTAAGKDRAFVALVTVDAADAASAQNLVRIGRALKAADTPTTTVAPAVAMNLAPDYKPDFPVMFNLILWLSVVLALAVYAIAYGLWNIDPGKDSIIYRRGYAHAKKD